MDANFVSELEQTLRLATLPDSVKAATLRMKTDFSPNPAIFPALIHILQNSQDDSIRKLAAVEARKSVTTKWVEVAPALQAEIRSSLLQFAFQYSNKSIRHLSARIISEIALLDIAAQQWDDLLPSLIAGANDANIETKEMAIFILSCILEETPENWLSFTNDFVTLFASILQQQPTEDIQIYSIAALEIISDTIEDRYSEMKPAAATFKSLMPLLLQILKNSLNFSDSENTKNVFNSFNAFVYIDLKIIGAENLINIINFMIETSLNTAVDEEIRGFAISCLTQIIPYRKGKITQAKLGPTLAQCALKIACEEDDEAESSLENEDEENENEEDQVTSLALRLLATLAAELPPSQVIGSVLELTPQLIQSSNPFEKRGTLLAIGVAVEGAPDYVSTQLPKIIQFIITGLQDSNIIVKAGALKTLNALSTELKETVADYHESLLPLIISIIDSTDKILVYKYATYALDIIVEFMSNDSIKAYMEPLMNKLFQMLDGAQSSSLKSAIVSAIGSVAYAAGKSFIPFFDASIKFLEKFIVNMDAIEGMTDDDIELRAQTFENISSMARAVGSESFSPYAQELIQASSLAIDSTNGRLREAGFAFISNMAKVYGQEFTSFLDKIIPEIVKCLQQQEFDVNIEAGEDIEDFDESKLADSFKVHTGITVEKEVALIALGELAVGTKDGFAKFAPSIFKVLAEQIDDSYAVRETSLATMWKIAYSLYQAQGLNDFTTNFIVMARKVTLELVVDEYEINMIITCLDLLCEHLKSMGQVTLMTTEADAKNVEELCGTLMVILKNEHPCQVMDEDAEEEEEEGYERDASESDEVLYDTVLEVLINLSSVFGADFVKIFGPFKDFILKNVNSKSKDKRSSSIGCLAEICNGMKGANPFLPELLEVFVNKLAHDKSYKVRGNAAYAVGIAIEFATFDVSSGYPTILQALSKLLNKADKEALKTEDGDDETKDNINNNIANACGCVCRLGLKNLQAVPLDAILPVLLSHLPLETAFEENKPIFEFILKLYAENNATILEQTPVVVEIFNGVFKKEFEKEKLLNESTLGREENIERLNQFDSDETKVKVVEFLKFLEGKYSGLVSSKEYLKPVISA